MSRHLVNSINWYRELHEGVDWERPEPEHMQTLALAAWDLIQDLACEMVRRGERRADA